jgi:hypothetical protein
MVNITPPSSPLTVRRRKVAIKQQLQCWLNLSFVALFVVVLLLSTMAWSGFTNFHGLNSAAALRRIIMTAITGISASSSSPPLPSSRYTGTAPATSPSAIHRRRHYERVEQQPQPQKQQQPPPQQQRQPPPPPPPRIPDTHEGDKSGKGEAEDDEDEDETTSVWSKATAQLQQKDGDKKDENKEDEEEDEDDDHDGPYGGQRDMPPLQEYFPGRKKPKPYNPETEDPIDKCRRDPTWRRSSDVNMYDECKRLMQWEPRDTWWRLDTGFNNFTLKGHVDDIHKCIAHKFDTAIKHNKYPWTQCKEDARNASCQVPPTEVTGYYRSKEEGEAVLFANAMTEQEVFGLRSLQGCMQKYLPQAGPWWEYREFGQDQENEVTGGNEVTFVQGMIQIFVPGIAATLYRNFRMAYEEGNWATHGFLNLGYPPPNSLGIRTAEGLEYRDSGRLGTHADSESMFTIAIALSEETSYQGGHFRLHSEHALFKVPRLGAVSFFAESFHGVTKVMGGDRSIFVVEIWESDDAPPGVPRCDPQSWFEHMLDRWPVITGAANEYLWDQEKENGEVEEQ